MTSPLASWSDETPYFAPQIQLDPRPPAMGAGLPFNPQRVLFNYIDDAGTFSPMFAQSSGARLRELLDLRFNIGREMHDNRENSYAENNGDR